MNNATDFELELAADYALMLREHLTPAARQRVKEALVHWLTFTVRKRPGADLADRLTLFCKQIETLAAEFYLTATGGSLLVTANGEASNTLQALRRGTDWFEPGDPDSIVVAAVLA